MPISIIPERDNRGQSKAITVRFTACPPEVHSAFLRGFPLYQMQSCIEDTIVYRAEFSSESAAITNLYALNKFLVPAEAICSDYESFMDSKANWEDRLFAAKRKYRDLCSNVSQLGNRAEGVSRSAYGAGKLVFEIIDELSACELELEKLGAKIAIASL